MLVAKFDKNQRLMPSCFLDVQSSDHYFFVHFIKQSQLLIKQGLSNQASAIKMYYRLYIPFMVLPTILAGPIFMEANSVLKREHLLSRRAYKCCTREYLLPMISWLLLNTSAIDAGAIPNSQASNPHGLHELNCLIVCPSKPFRYSRHRHRHRQGRVHRSHTNSCIPEMNDHDSFQSSNSKVRVRAEDIGFNADEAVAYPDSSHHENGRGGWQQNARADESLLDLHL